ncbi:MAG TPA: TonB-dependent receptor, partial [Candidatus Dormibacteraeota bacterium]|nr:TonB-dependent receptor [Candidatus Dormibacteraeota bacterium]
RQEQFSAYLIRYRLDLWSTFTSYLKDPVYGDQMLQHDDRVVYGAKLSKTWFGNLGGAPLSNLLGAQLRVDELRDDGIFPTYRRRILGTTQDAAVTESSAALYFENTIEWRPWLRSSVGLRGDGFGFQVRDKMVNADGSCDLRSDPLGCDSGQRRAAILSPKAGLVAGPWARTSYFINVGDGYHSNDARGITRSGTNPEALPVTPLTRAVSAELGVRSRIVPAWESSLDVFRLRLRSELTFSGDAGSTAPSAASTRTGVEWGNRAQFASWLSGELNAAFTRARFDHDPPPDDLGCAEAAATHPCEEPASIVGRYIPNSPTSVVEAALNAQGLHWFASLRARHFGAAPLVEDDSARSPAYTTIDARLGLQSGQHWLAALEVFNLGDAKWNDIEYYYVTRLQNQAAPAAGYVVHPGVPRTIRARLQYQF